MVPRVICIVLAVLAATLFCGANLFHWIEVVQRRLPLYYTFPQHTFKVVDADTGKPLEGVIAVYLYRAKALGGSEDPSRLLDMPGVWIHALYLKIANPLRHEHLDAYGRDYIAHVAEAVSGADGTIVFPSDGPFLRRRNHYFETGDAPEGFLLKEGYVAQRLNDRGGPPIFGSRQDRPVPGRSVPEWSAMTLGMQAGETSASGALGELASALDLDLRSDNQGSCDEAMLPLASAYLAGRMAGK